MSLLGMGSDAFEMYEAMAQVPVVINVGESGDGDVYIGRGSPWDNPFRIGVHGTREQVIAKYREWFHAPEQHALRARTLRELRGKRLACFCKPQACHGDVVAEYVADDLGVPYEA